MEVVKSCVGTKFIGRWSDLAVKIALDAVETVTLEENGRKEIDIKRYAKVEKVNLHTFSPGIIATTRSNAFHSIHTPISGCLQVRK